MGNSWLLLPPRKPVDHVLGCRTRFFSIQRFNAEMREADGSTRRYWQLTWLACIRPSGFVMLFDFNLRAASVRLQEREPGGDGNSVGGLLNIKRIPVEVSRVAAGTNPTVNDARANKIRDLHLQLRISYWLFSFNL